MKRILAILLVLLVFVVLATSVVLAAGTFSANITIIDTSGTTREVVPTLVTMGIEEMVNQGFLDSTGLYSRVYEGTQKREFMVAEDRLGVLVLSLTSYQTRMYRFETGWDTPVASNGIIVGTGGSISTPDHNDLELGDIFQLEFGGYIDTAAVGSNLIYNEDAFRFYVQDTGKIRAAILTTDDVEVKYCTTTTIGSDFNKVRVASDSDTMKIYLWVVDEWVEKASVDLESTVVPVITNTWYFNQDNAMPYIEYVKIWTD